MNSIHNLFAKEDSSFVFLSSKEKGLLCKCVTLYLFRGCEERELSELCKETLGWTGLETIKFRRNLLFNGHIQKNLKFYLYAYLCSDGARSSEYGIGADDQRFASNLNSAEDEYSVRLRKRCRKMNMAFPPRSMTVFEDGIERVVKELDSYCKRFVWKKMKFIIDATATKPEDLVQEVMQFGIYTMYKAYPEIKSYLHLTNIAKTGIHNRGQNIIQEATTKSRNAYITNGDGSFSASTLSIHGATAEGATGDLNFMSNSYGLDGGCTISVCNNLVAGRSGACVEGEPISDCERLDDLKQAVESLRRRMTAARPRNFLDILMGHYHEGFSVYLKANQIPRDNDDWYDEVDRLDYAEAARVYLDIPRDQARKFVLKLRKVLRPFVSPN